MSISVNDVIEAQAHIGTLKSEAHPKTNKFLGDNIIPDVDRSDNIINVEK